MPSRSPLRLIAAMGEKIWTEVAEGEEPRHSGPWVSPPYPTFSHFATHFPTGSVRRGPRAPRGGSLSALQRAFAPVGRGGTGTHSGARFRAAAPAGCNLACKKGGWHEF